MQALFPGNRFFRNHPYNAVMAAGRPRSKSAPDFGERLALIRQAQGLTQAELGQKIGVSEKMIEYYERRAVNIKSDTIKKLAVALKVSADELLGLKPITTIGRKSKVLQKLEQVSALPKRDQELAVNMLDRIIGTASKKKAS